MRFFPPELSITLLFARRRLALTIWLNLCGRSPGRAYARPHTLLEGYRRSRTLPFLLLLALLGPFVPRSARADSLDPITTSSDVAATSGQIGLAAPETTPSAAAGTLARASVDPSTGALHVAIDFDLPQARGGVQPALALGYSSAGTYGVGGLGWSLNLPSIERRNPSGPPQFQNDPAPGAAVVPAQQDRFTFGGEPLVEICFISSGGVCAQLAAGEQLPSFAVTGGWHYYRLQTETGALLRFFWSPNHLTWVVQDKKGAFSEYGEARDQSSTAMDTDANGYVFRWDLVRRYDSQRIAASAPANPVLYVWTPFTAYAGGTLRYLTDVYDTSRPGAQSPAPASFAHHTHLAYAAVQPQMGASPIAPVWLALPTFLLTRVDVASQDYGATGIRQQVRRYHLAYVNGGTTEQQALQQVQLEGNCTGAGGAGGSAGNNFEVNGQLPDPSVAKSCPMRPATTFSYLASGISSLSALNATATTMPSLSGNATSPLLFDINNDGLPDVLDTQATPAVAWINAIASGGTTKVGEGDTFTKAPLSLGASVYDLNNINQLLPGPSFATGIFQADGRIDMLWRATSQASVSNAACPDPAIPGRSLYCDSSVPFALLNASEANGAWTLTPVPTGGFLGLQTRFPDFIATDSTSSVLNNCPSTDFFLGQVSDQTEILGGETPLASLDINGDGLADSFDLVTWGYLQTAQIDSPFESTNYCGWSWPQYGVRLSRKDFTGQYYPFNGLSYSAPPPPSSTPVQPGARTEICIGDGPSVTYLFGPAGTIGYGLPGDWTATWSLMSTMTTPADMDGDGIMDLVSVYTGTWWPGHGDGVFGMCPEAAGDAGAESAPTASFVQCSCGQAVGAVLPWSLPSGSTVYGVHDVTGDGLADMVAAVPGGVSISQNLGYAQGSVSFAPPVTIQVNSLLEWSGNAAPSNIYFGDMDASGVDDIILQEVPAGGTKATLLGYVDLFGHERPGLLQTINGYDLQTQIAYASTPQLEVAVGGWATHSPQPLHAVTSLTTSDTTGDSYTTSFAYWNPAFDGRDNQFLGYRRVRQTSPGSAATLTNTDTTYFYGVCGADAGISCVGVDYPLGSYRGLPTLVEVFGPVPPPPAAPSPGTTGGTPVVSPTYLSTTHHSYATTPLYQANDGRVVRRLYETQTDTFLYDTSPFQLSGEAFAVSDVNLPGYSTAISMRGASPHHLQKRMSLDAFGNIRTVTDSGDLGDESSTPADPVIMTTTVWYIPEVVNPGNNWIWRLQSVTVGASASDPSRRVTTYSHDPHGNILDVNRSLVGTAALVRPSTGAPNPAVFSRDGTAVLAHVDYDPAGTGNPIDVQSFPGETSGNTAPRCTQFSFDPSYGQLLTTVSVNVGGCNSAQTLATQHIEDRVLEVETSTIGPNGARSATTYDWFGRPLTLAKPDPVNVGQTLPASTTIDYVDTSYGQLVHTNEAAGAGYSARDTYVYEDGLGRTIQTVSTADQTGEWIVSGRVSLDARGRPTLAYVPYFASATDGSTLYSGTPPSVQSTGVSYDVFSRITQTTDIDGTVTSSRTYHALSVEARDAEQSLASGPHVGAYTLARKDGHGRDVENDAYGNGGRIATTAGYLATGEVTSIMRAGSDANGPVAYTRFMQYDSMGRMVVNAEPNTSAPPSKAVSSGTNPAWTYAYDDLGDLGGTSDARGCGENFAYDGAGRLLSEDFSPCSTSLQAPWTPPSTTPGDGDGTEAFYVYEGGALQTGQLSDVYDRASHVHLAHDGRGRLTEVDRQIANPGAPATALVTRYSPTVFTENLGYDDRDRVVSQSTGTDVPELSSSTQWPLDGASSYLAGSYSPRGALQAVTSSYGPLVTGTVLEADGRPDSVTFGDAAKTTVSYTYGDARRRLTEAKIWRAGSFPKATTSYTPPAAGAAQPTQQTILADDVVPGGGYDAVSNPLQLRDNRLEGEWPAGALPVTSRSYVYDDAYRVTTAATAFAAGTADTFVSPLAATTATQSPAPFAKPSYRMTNQTFAYDGLGNTISTTDDSETFFDRSLGRITNGGTGPNQITSAVLTSSTAGHAGTLAATYDAAGNMVQLAVERDGLCTSTAGCNQLFEYDWDEVGRLARARRFDFVGGVTCTPIPIVPVGPVVPEIVAPPVKSCHANPLPSNFTYPALPSQPANADVSYAYDANGSRVLRSSTPRGESTTYSAEIFPSLRLNATTWDATTSTYDRTTDTEAVYLVFGGAAFGRVVYDEQLPAINGPLHVFLELTDRLSSVATVIDKDTSELVERTTYLPYGAPDSDYRPDRWQAFRESYKFTGKEDDVEVGLTYFGARYYSPQLGRWISPDPLAIHELGADLNPYAYVRGRVTVATDPDGQEDDDGYTWTYSPPPVVTTLPPITITSDGFVDANGDELPSFLLPFAGGALPDPGPPELGTIQQWAGDVEEGVGAFLYGFTQGITPGGMLASAAPLPPDAQSGLFQYWMGAGMMSGGLAGAVNGVAGVAAGVGAEAPSFGTATAVVVVSAAAVANGITAIGVGWTHLQQGAVKGPPNPYGRTGGPAHQGTVADVAEDVRSRGLTPRQEYKVDTPGGEKGSRFVDVVGADENGNISEMHQVGRQTQGGNPVAREVRALDDIENATGTRPTFHPYN